MNAWKVDRSPQTTTGIDAGSTTGPSRRPTTSMRRGEI